METSREQAQSEYPTSSAQGSKRWSPRLLGVTATGPVYRTQRSFVVLPFGSACMLLRELAAKAQNPYATVVSSLAKRVSGDAAYRAWVAQSVRMTALLPYATSRGRLAFLRNTLHIIRSVGYADGLEPVLSAAVNAAWPWLSTTSTERLLEYSAGMLRRSEFAQQRAVPVLNATARTASLFPPGELAAVDLDEWRTRRALDQDEFLSGRSGFGPRGRDLPGMGGLGGLIDGLFGGGGSAGSLDEQAAGLLGENNPGVPGGLPGAGDLPGRGGTGGGGSGAQSLDDQATGLLGGNNPGVPGGLPSAGDLPGRGQGGAPGGPPGGASSGGGQFGDLLSSIPGSGYRGVSGWIESHGTGGFAAGGFSDATPGGPFAPTGKLGANTEGNAGWTDAVRDVAAGVGLVAGIVVAVATAEFTIPLAVGAVVGVAAGSALIGLGTAEGVNESNKPPPPDEPHNGDLYPGPDPDGGGNPTQLPDQEGGGGRPNTIWDANGGGGTPLTISDENFGKPGPTVRPASFTARVLSGSGLAANIVQVGPSTVRF